MEYDVVKECEHMFDYVYICTKNIFYEFTFYGNDWDKLYIEYKKYLLSIGNSYEFTKILSKMLKELNISHSNAHYNNNINNNDTTTSLNIFINYTHKKNNIKITKV